VSLGAPSSVGELAAVIASGTRDPFFAEEMVGELAQRRVLAVEAR